MDNWAHVPQELLDRAGHESGGIGNQPGLFGRVLKEGFHPACDEVAGGVATGIDQKEKEPVELLRREPIAVDLGFDQSSGEIVAGVPSFALGHARGVAVHLDHRSRPLLERQVWITRVHHLGELVQPPSVVERNAHQLSDDVRRHLAR
jgi:hypothetical protein